MNGETTKWATWVRVTLEVAAIIIAVGFYMATVVNNSARISTLEQEYETLAPLSQTEKAVSDQRYEEIQRQLSQIQASISDLQRKAGE